MRTYFMLMFIVLTVPAGVNAAVIEFTDNTIYMESWASGYHSENSMDSIENPDFSGGRLYLEGNTLTGVQLDFTSNHWSFGDLFIDKNNNGYFDYVLNAEEGTIYGFADQQLSSKKGDNDALYTLSNQYYPHRTEGEIRHDHFSSLNLDSVDRLIALGLAQDLGFYDYDKRGGNLLVFDSFRLDLAAEGEFSFVYTPQCANDVISHTAAVPLPGTFVLLSAGIIGLMGARRKIQGR